MGGVQSGNATLAIPLLYIHVRVDKFNWIAECISFEVRFVKEIIAGGTPSISRQGLASISSIALNSVAGNYGDAAIAAMSVVTRIGMFIFSVIIGLGQGFQPMCGFCYGAKLYDRVKEGFWFSTKIGTVFLLFWSVVLIIFSEEAVALFRKDPDVIAIGIKALRYQMIVFPACSFMMMANVTVKQKCARTIRTHFCFYKSSIFPP